MKLRQVADDLVILEVMVRKLLGSDSEWTLKSSRLPVSTMPNDVFSQDVFRAGAWSADVSRGFKVVRLSMLSRKRRRHPVSDDPVLQAHSEAPAGR